MQPPVDRSSRSVRGTWMRALATLGACALQLCAANAEAATFAVNSAADVPDAIPGNGICETATGNAVCTLRAAIMEANALAGADTISLQANKTYLLTRSGAGESNGELKITDSVSISGAGPDSTIIDGNRDVLGTGVFQIAQCLGAASFCDAQHPLNVVNLSGFTIQHGFALLGGGVENSGATLTIDNCKIIENYGLEYGGGVYNLGTLTISNSTISANSMDMLPGFGGGIYSHASTTVRNTTVSGNFAVSGGGIDAAYGTLVVVNSTISGNFTNGDGAGIYAESGTTSLYNATVVYNQANTDGFGTAHGGGVANTAASTLVFVNSIIALNENVLPTAPDPTLIGDDCSGAITSQGNNIVTDVDSTHCTIVGPPTGVTIVDPHVDALHDNGGPTLTHALLATSKAINGGNHNGCTDNLGAPITTDQRGSPRPNGAYCDIGAFEAFEFIFQNGFDLGN